jgi:hypothetical protein
MGARFSRDSHMGVQVALDRVLADQDCSRRHDEDGDGVGASAHTKQGTVVAFDWHLAGEVVDPELGQSLPHTAGGGAPLGLPELVHRGSPVWAWLISLGILLYN